MDLDTNPTDKNDQNQNKILLSKEEWEERTKRGNFSQDQGRGRGQGRGHGRGRYGRFQSYEDRREQGMYRDKQHIKCYNYQEYGHYATECPKKEIKEEEVNLTQDEYEPATLL